MDLSVFVSWRLSAAKFGRPGEAAGRIPKARSRAGRAHCPVFRGKTVVRREEHATRGMAIYHMHGSFGSRQNGQSALAKASYLLRRGKYARGRDDLVDGFWGHLPDWCADDGLALFEAADRFERANGRLFEELEGALPCELTLGQSIELALTMAHKVTASGLPYLLVIHDGRPPAPGVPRNRHWHLQFLERINDGLHRTPERWFQRANRQHPPAGGALKDRHLKGHEWLPRVRREYERLVNEALERTGHLERVTAASHRDRIARAEAAGDHETAEQLRRRPPGLHVGPVASAIERGRPGRNERSTERGDLARSREAEAARWRADLERVEGELNAHHRAAVTAARDAGVEEVLIAAAKPGDPDTVIALDGATETRRREIRAFAREQGFDDDVIDQIRRTAQPDDPDLGWSDVVESIEAHVGQVERARALGLPVDVDAVVADARRRGTNPVHYLVQVNEIWDTARRAGLSNQGLTDIYGRAEKRQAGTGWSAIEDATVERVERKSTLEAAARSVFVDIEAVYGNARDRNEDELDAIEGETARAKPVVLAARAAGLGDSAIGRICRDAELKEYGTGWAAVSQATAERVERRSAAETAARELDLSVEFIYASTRHGADPVDHLEGVTAIWGRARRAGLSNQGLNDIYGRAEKRQAGTGWSAIEDATVERVERKSTLEAAARSVFVDIEAVYGNARDRNEDELDAIEGETARAKPVVLAARAAGLGDSAIGRICRDAELKEYGTGWAAVSQATAERVERRSAAETAARELDLSVEFIYASTRHGADPVDHLEGVTAIWGRARRAGLSNQGLNDIYGRAEKRKAGTGWSAIEDATAERVERKSTLEAAARSVFVDVEAVYGNARDRNEDELDAIEGETARAKPVVLAARAAGLDDAAIKRIVEGAESAQRASGWAAVSQAAAARVQRRSELEAAARRVLVDVDAVYKDAGARNADELEALEQAVAEAQPVVAAARAAGLDDAAIRRIRREAGSKKPGSGWAAVTQAIAARVQRRSELGAAARRVLVDIDAVYKDARAHNVDELEALEQAVAEAQPVVAAARAAGLDDAAIRRIRREAGSKKPGSGWAAVTQAIAARVQRRSELEAAARRVLVDIDAVYKDAPARNADELDALEQVVAEAQPVVAAARAAGLDDAAIRRIRREAGSKKAGSGWTAVTQATAERVQRRSELEVAARRVLVDVDAVYKDAVARNADELDALAEEIKKAQPVVAAARAAGLDDATVRRIRREAGSKKAGSGWTAVTQATAERVQRRSELEVAARRVLVDVDAVYKDAVARNADELDALAEEIKKAQPVVAAARAAGLDDATVRRIRREAESKKAGSGWTAVAQATAERAQRKSELEAAARRVLVDVDAVYKDAVARNADELDALAEEIKKAQPVVAAARAAGLDDATVRRIRREAESKKAGSGWTAVAQATAERAQRKSELEAAARRVLVDVDAVYKDAVARTADELDALAEETKKAEPVVVAARAAGLDDATIKRIHDEAAMVAGGSGWAAVSKVTEQRVQRELEAAARRVLVDIDAVYKDAVARNADELDALAEEIKKAQPVVAAARAGGLDVATIGRIRREAESKKAGSGWTAVAQATAERAQRKSELEAAARRVLVDVDAVYKDAVARTADELDALEEETKKAGLVVAAARAAGLDDATIGRIRREAENKVSGSGWTAVSEATGELTELAAEEQHKRGELAELTAEVRATSAGAERLKEKRRARLDATKGSLTLDEELIVVKEVKALIEVDLARRVGNVEASPGGGELLRRAEHRRGGAILHLAEREETIEAVELRVQAADAAVAGLAALGRDPERPDRHVPPVINDLLDAVPADGDDPFPEDVVRLLQARFSHAEQKGVDRGGYSAKDREISAQRHFGRALASAFKWCVLTIRALILAACHKILGGRGETGTRVRTALEATDSERQSRQSTAHEEARAVAIDPNAFSEEVRATGRDEVAAMMEETARRRQVISDAMANNIDVEALFRAAEVRKEGSGFAAIEATVERRRQAVAAAKRLHVDVDAVCAAARSKNEDPVEALLEETARRTKVHHLSDFMGLSVREFEDIFQAAEQLRRGSGYTAIENECIRRLASELVNKELPFAYSGPVHSGTWALAVFGRAEADLLREVRDDGFVHGRLSEVLATSPGNAQERQGAQRCYHRPELERELQRLEAQRGLFSSKPTEEDALQVVLKRFIPELGERVRAACAGIADLDRSVARIVEDDWVRRVLKELPGALPSARPDAGGSSSTAACRGLDRIAAATDDGSLKKVIVGYQTQHEYGASDRQRAENALLERRRREEEASGRTRANAEVAAHRAHEAELLRILHDVCRRVQSREFDEIARERVNDRVGKPCRPGPAMAHSQRPPARAQPDQSRGRSL